MELRVRHRTTYHYQSPVDMAQHMLHLSPRGTDSQQVLTHQLRIEPEPAAMHQSGDAFGNLRTFFAQQAPHEALSVLADSTVLTQAPQPLPEGAPWKAMTWERVREHFRYRVNAPYEPTAEFVFASPLVPRDAAFSEWARPAFASGRPVLQATRALMEKIHGELVYETDSTEVTTPPLEALAQGKGVCQDFAHIMIGCLRSLGLPARYVSGYLLTQPPPGKPRLIGADASHAWVSLFVPGADGQDGQWFDFDPTNNRCGWGSPGEDYVTLAIGRDFSDVSPMRGVIQGGAQHTLDVAVTVAPPAELEGRDLDLPSKKPSIE
ncbi:MAG: transglutaminase family protein [Hydrogenophaga sp.]|uniref:transglutaminase family protein n=1 Tax=Hydrogenophaga sp. TaxID=1904254 RepID=UPI001D5F8CD1|nr:transglutaminase family protein [Hydrogenophaga sp.]MBX3609961.1 transglutaminase family protein [Hydrogenophaga sp.]